MVTQSPPRAITRAQTAFEELERQDNISGGYELMVHANGMEDGQQGKDARRLITTDPVRVNGAPETTRTQPFLDSLLFHLYLYCCC